MSSSEHGEVAEPDSQTIDLVRALSEMRNNSKRRKEGNRRAIEAFRKKRVEKAKAEMDQIKEAHDSKVSASQTQQYAGLRRLLHKRQLLELDIYKSLQRIESGNKDLTKVLDAVYAERLEACLEVLATGNVRQA